MYNLFIVHSPLQFLGALEAREHFKTKNNLLIVKFSRVDSNNEQLMQLLELFPWDESMILDYAHQGSRWLENTKIIKQLKKERMTTFSLVPLKFSINLSEPI